MTDIFVYMTTFPCPCNGILHDDVIKWKHFPHYWPFVRGIYRSPVNSSHKVQWRGALMFSLICAWINGWVNNREAGDLRRNHAHYDVTVMLLYCFGKLDIKCLKAIFYDLCLKMRTQKYLGAVDELLAFCMIVHFSAHILKWELVCKFGVRFHISIIISCLGSRFHASSVFFYSMIAFTYTEYFVHSYTVDVAFTLSYWEHVQPVMHKPQHSNVNVAVPNKTSDCEFKSGIDLLFEITPGIMENAMLIRGWEQLSLFSVAIGRA